MSLSEAVHAYIGPNAAHIAFKRELVNAKVLILQINGNRQHLREWFHENVESARASAGPNAFSIGFVTEVVSPTIFKCINVAANEAHLIAQNYDALEQQLYANIYIDIQRILETFLIELYVEIARKDPRVLKSDRKVTFEEALSAADAGGITELLIEKQRTFLSHADREGLERYYDELNLSLVKIDDGMTVENTRSFVDAYKLLWAARNILQHNHGVVNEIFLKMNGNTKYSLGDRVHITAAELGDAFAAAEVTANSVNRRAVQKFALS